MDCAVVYPSVLPGVNLDSEPQPPSRRDELSQAEEPELGFCPVRPGGGREGGATDRPLEGKGTFHSSWAREELDTEPPPAPPGDHLDSPGLAAGRKPMVVRITPHLILAIIVVYREWGNLATAGAWHILRVPPDFFL